VEPHWRTCGAGINKQATERAQCDAGAAISRMNKSQCHSAAAAAAAAASSVQSVIPSLFRALPSVHMIDCMYMSLCVHFPCTFSLAETI